MNLINSNNDGTLEVDLAPNAIYEQQKQEDGSITLRPVHFGPIPKLAAQPHGVYVAPGNQIAGRPTTITIFGDVGQYKDQSRLVADLAHELALPVIVDNAGLGQVVIDHIRGFARGIDVIAYNSAANRASA